MPRFVSSDRGNIEVELGGKVHKRNKDGTFHVNGPEASLLKRSGDFAIAGTNFQRAQGYTCLDCGFVALLKDHCGRCDGSNLEPENS